MPKKIGVVLFNLGGPDSPEAVKPFLFNLFNDKAIITLPNPFRFLLAKIISSRRAPVAKQIYSEIGGKSPIFEETEKQAKALEQRLNNSNNEYKTFIAMRYWHPFSYEALNEVEKYKPDEIILLPLYPQYSSATTASSLNDWLMQCKKSDISIPTDIIHSYQVEDNFINSHAKLILNEYEKVSDKNNLRILFSAHGLPQKLIDAGDPYQLQIEQTTSSIVQKLSIKNLDWKVCYQSKVGRLKWLEPSTENEIIEAGKENRSLIIVPIAFVSEHSETLVELDIEYKKLAESRGVRQYLRVPALGSDELFINCLARLCKNDKII
ncbi:MAG: Ferrochelatase [Rickettsiaceae bacterium]|jgi:ferrochelatase|nr:Ferrochelatase [Rickettsiaceae bacterium]